MKVNEDGQKVIDSESELEKLLHSFERYYDVKTEGVADPFCAEAEFHSHTEQYFLVKAAHLSDIDSNDYVFFAQTGLLNPNYFTELVSQAWQTGLSKITPYSGHRNSDVTLIILSEKIEDNTIKQIKKAKHYKSYKFGFYGWSSLRILAYEISTGRAFANRRGCELRKLVSSL